MFRILVSDQSRGVRVATLPSWAVGLGAIGAALIGLTLFVIGAGLALVFAPLAIGVIAIARWRLRGMMRSLREQSAQAATAAPARPVPSDPSIIEGEYRVIEPGSR